METKDGLSFTDRSSNKSQFNSSRSNASEINLLLQGTPAPRCPRRTMKQRTRPLPPPNSPCTNSLDGPIVPLPIDRIFIQKESIVTCKISKRDYEQLSINNESSFSLKSPLLKKTESTCGFYKYSNGNSQVNPLDSGLSFSHRTCSETSLYPELAIDLSSVNDSEPESASSRYSANDQDSYSETESSRKNNNLSSPLFIPYSHTIKKSFCKRSSYFSSETSSSSSKSIPKSQKKLAVMALSGYKSSSSNYPGSSRGTTIRSSSTHSRRSADLICTYVDNYGQAELGKYLRPCISCKEPCCICPESQQYDETNISQMLRNGSIEDDRPTNNPNDPNSPSDEKKCFFEDCKESEQNTESNRIPVTASENLSESQNSEFSQFMIKRASSGGNVSAVDEEKSPNSLLSKRHVSLSIMQLSTAAQCARILADSLEGVLQLAKEEVTSLAGSPAPSLFDTTSDSLEQALDTVKKAYPCHLFSKANPDIENDNARSELEQESSVKSSPDCKKENKDTTFTVAGYNAKDIDSGSDLVFESIKCFDETANDQVKIDESQNGDDTVPKTDQNYSNDHFLDSFCCSECSRHPSNL